ITVEGESEQNTTETTKKNTSTVEVDNVIVDSNVDRFYNTAMDNFKAA
ncbi:11414_t:CDS:1, partial [Cetraspora pellucida]